MEPNAKYTVVAAKALSLAEIFKASFQAGLPGRDTVGKFKVELSAPDGPSTAGGKQALQHIKLVPEGGGPTIVIGSADTTRAVAEIRTFDHVSALYTERFKGTPIPLDGARFNELARHLTNFFKGMNMKVSFAELEPNALSARQALAPATTRGAPPPRSWLLPIACGVAGAALVAVAYIMVFLR